MKRRSDTKEDAQEKSRPQSARKERVDKVKKAWKQGEISCAALNCAQSTKSPTRSVSEGPCLRFLGSVPRLRFGLGTKKIHLRQQIELLFILSFEYSISMPAN